MNSLIILESHLTQAQNHNMYVIFFKESSRKINSSDREHGNSHHMNL